MKRTIVALILSLAFLMPFSVQATPVDVDLELSLLVDVSGSIVNSEFDLQKQGYVDAFNNSAIWNAISQGAIGKIAANLIYWSGASEAVEAVGWTLIDSEIAMNDFATAIDNTTRPYSGMTAVQSALEFASGRFTDAFNATRVIDISGDGADNNSPAGTNGKATALANTQIDTINGIVIGTSSTVYNYYQNYVVGGPNAFLTVANSFNDFGDAIDDKLIREITNIPEPGTLLLMGIGMLGFAGFGRRKR